MENYVLRDLDSLKPISGILNEQGKKLENKVLDQKIIESNYYISKQLNVPLATKIFYLEKIRSVDEIPASIDKTYIPFEEVKGLEMMDFNNASLYSLLKSEKGIHKLKSDEEILLVQANDFECEILNLKKGDDILLTKGTTTKKNGRILEYFEISSLPEFYRFRSVSRL